MSNAQAISEWLKLPERTRLNIFEETARRVGLPNAAAVEKDWWVVRTLELVFASTIGAYTVFKGGTCLSKAWGLIDRFSEDIDLALDRRLLGFNREDKDMNNSQVVKLRKHSSRFISERLFPEMQSRFTEAGFTDVVVHLGDNRTTDTDPMTIEIHYQPVTDKIQYILPQVLIEIGSRSLIEHHTARSFSSMVGEQFRSSPFADANITIPAVNPERTFLEKIFLLHETFQAGTDGSKIERKSRHLYDLEKLMDTEFASSALKDKVLYNRIVEHRQKLTPVRGVDYANHAPDKINPIPPDDIISEWEKDYKVMQSSLLQGSSLPFDRLIGRMYELKARINSSH